MGPGTNIAQRLINHDKPLSFEDYNARQHDIDYLKSAGESALEADSTALAKALKDPSLQGLTMAAAMGGKILLDNVIDTKLNGNIIGLDIPETRELGNLLEKQYITNDWQLIQNLKAK